MPEQTTTLADRRDIGALVPAALDDAGLDPYAFRVYARLARRAGQAGGCFESQGRMAAACRMSERRLRYALAELEARGMIAREDHDGTATRREGTTVRWVLTPATAWTESAPDAADDAEPAPGAATEGGTPAPDADPPAPDADPPRHGVPTPPGMRCRQEGVQGEGVQVKGSQGREPPVAASASTRVEPDDGFERFWNLYPRGKAGKPGGDGSKTKARTRWRNMTQQQRALALAAVPNYADWVERPEGSIPAHATTWLNQNRWEQWQEPADPWAGRKVSNAERFDALADEIERREQGGQA